MALTGYGQPDDHQRSDEAGFDAHLTKPAEPEALLRILRQAGASQQQAPRIG